MKNSLLILFLLLSFTVHSNEEPLNVVTEDWPPFILKGQEVSGIVTQNIREILAYTDIKYSIDVYPWARSFHLATSNANVLIYSIYKTKQRESKFHWFCPVYKSTPIHAYKLASNKINIDSLEALKTSVVGIMRGDNSHSYFLQKGFQEGVNIDLSSNEETNLKKLIKGRVDVVIQSQESLNYRLASLGASGMNLISGLEISKGESAEHCMALSLNTEDETINKISKGFKEWHKYQQ
jgi:polar amino acid transport system substrate-binding protein